MSDIDKDWCIDAAKREDGCEVGVDTLGMNQPLVKLRLKLTKAEKEIERLQAENNRLREELKKAKDAKFDGFMAGLGPSRWEQ